LPKHKVGIICCIDFLCDAKHYVYYSKADRDSSGRMVHSTSTQPMQQLIKHISAKCWKI